MKEFRNLRNRGRNETQIANELSIPIEEVRDALIMTRSVPRDLRGRFENIINDANARSGMHKRIADYYIEYERLPPYLQDEDTSPEAEAQRKARQADRIQQEMQEEAQFEAIAEARGQQADANLRRRAMRKAKQIEEGSRPSTILTKQERDFLFGGGDSE